MKEDARAMKLAAEDNLAAASIRREPAEAAAAPSEPRDKSMFNISKIKLFSTIDLNLEKFPEALQKALEKKDEMDAKLQEIKSKTPSAASQVEDILKDVVVKYSKNKTHLEELKEEVSCTKTLVSSATNADELKEARKAATESMKRFTRGDAKEFAAVVRTVHAFYEKELRSAASAAVPIGTKAPIVLTLEQYIIDEKLVIGAFGSVFEAKAGVRGTLIAPASGEDPVSVIAAQPWFKSAKRVLENHLKNNSWGVADVDDVKKVKKTEKSLLKSFDPSVFSKLALPSPSTHPWAAKVYGMQAFGSQAGFTHVGVPHMGCIEARLLVSGRELVLGVEVSRVPGASMREKRAFMHSAPLGVLKDLVTKYGFALLHDCTHLAVIPSGFLVLGCAFEKSFGVRWSVSADGPDTNRVKAILADLLENFPELKQPSTGYSSFLNYLGD